MTKPLIHQLNLSRGLGGAEIYTHSFSRALERAGWPTELLVHRDARFWGGFDFEAIRVVRIDADGLLEAIPKDAIVVVHGSVPEPQLTTLKAHARLVALAHHTLSEFNRYRYYEVAHWLLPVSRHVMSTLDRHGLRNYDRQPLYGFADVARGDAGAPIEARSAYEWDSRKGRDRMLARTHPWLMRLRKPPRFARRPGLTLGIVSRIADLKQFPALFERVAPAIAAHADVSVEIFGAGVYQKVRALERSLGRIRTQVRFWGWQSNVAAVYASIDYLLTGLPEREALGLNVVEAQACGVPVLAVDAPPFNELILDGRTGFLYRDPREDGGAEFATLLDRVCNANARPDPLREREHLAQFSLDAFTARVDGAMRRALQRFDTAAEASTA